VIYLFLFMVISYPMIGFNGGVGEIFRYYVLMLTATEVAYALGILIGAAAPSAQAAVSLSAVCILCVSLLSFVFPAEAVIQWKLK